MDRWIQSRVSDHVPELLMSDSASIARTDSIRYPDPVDPSTIGGVVEEGDHSARSRGIALVVSNPVTVNVIA